MIEVQMDMSKRDDEKRKVFEQMSSVCVVTVQFDARREGVDVPAHMDAPPNALIMFSPRYGTILTVTEKHVSQMLSFPGFGESPVTVPWSAVYALHPSKRGAASAIWAADVPSELRRAFGVDTNALN